MGRTAGEARAAVGAVVRIDYVNAYGEASTRDVRLEGVHRWEDHLYLSAYCLLVHEERTFRLDRIKSLAIAGSPNDTLDVEVYFSAWIAALPQTPLPTEYTLIPAADRAFVRLAVLPLMWVLAAEPGTGDDAILLECARARLAQRAPFSEKDFYRWANWISEQAPTFDVAASCMRRLNKRDRVLLETAVRLAVCESPRRAVRAKRLKIGC